MVVRAIKVLRQSGVAMSKVRGAVRLLSRLSVDGQNIANAVLFYDGRNLYVVDGRSLSITVAPTGQAAFAEVVLTIALPVGMWAQEALGVLQPIDITSVELSRQRAIEKKAARLEALSAVKVA
jgi:hypothetical protein